MDARHSSTYNEGFATSSAGVGKKRLTFAKGTLKTKSGNFFISIKSIQIYRSYLKNSTDEISIDFEMPLGDYLRHVVPDKDKLEMSIEINTAGKRLNALLKVILDDGDRHMTATQLNEGRFKELNNQGNRVTVTCLDKAYLDMRVVTTYGNFTDCTVGDVILTHLGKGKGLASEAIKALGLDVKMVKINNDRKYKNLIVPSGTKILTLPFYLQKEYGVYNGDIGLYKSCFTDSSFYVYPLYRNDIYDFFDKKLHITLTQDTSAKHLDTTYMIDDDIIRLYIKTDGVPMQDKRGLKDAGNKLRATTAHNLHGRPFQVSPKEIKIESKQLQHTSQHKDTEGLVAPIVDAGVTDNLYDARSQVLSKDGYYVELEWQDSLSRLIVPMMHTTVSYVDNGKTIQKDGILHGIDIWIDNKNNREITTLHVFIKNRDDTNGVKSHKLF